MSKLDVHATSPKYVRQRRNAEAILRRADRSPKPKALRRAATTLRHCPFCGHGLSRRYRAAGEPHLRRNATPPTVCAWAP